MITSFDYMSYISDMSRYINIVYIRMHLVYLVLAYAERLVSTVWFFFLAISELLAILYLWSFLKVLTFLESSVPALYYVF